MEKGKSIIAFGLVLLCLFASSVVYFQPTKAENQGVITINQDGSISPSTATIQRAGDIFTLKKDLVGELWLNRSNTILDGAGFAISGAMSGVGLDIFDSCNVTIKNLTISNGVQGISIGRSSGVIVTNVTIRGTGVSLPFAQTWAISIQNGNSNQIVGNNIIDNMVGFFIAETSNNTIQRNNIVNCSSMALGLYDSSNNLIYDNAFINNSDQFVDEGIGHSSPKSVNTWDYGTIGNFWSDYRGNGSYVIDANNIDYHPLTHQAATPSPSPAIPELSWLTILPLLASLFFIAVILTHRKNVSDAQ
jgi:parallel beta-helix repeat protein